MHEARTSAQGLRSFARRLDSLRPGLYRSLRELERDQEQFIDGLRYVIDEVVPDSSAGY